MQTRQIKRIISHPFFNDYTYDYDIAVLELQKPVTFTAVVQPICLPAATHNFPVGKDLWVTGWGATAEGGTGASILQKAEIRLINQTVCNQLLTDQLTPRMMCVGILTGGVDACQVRQHLDLVLVIRQGDRPLLSSPYSGTSTYIYIFNIKQMYGNPPGFRQWTDYNGH